MVINRQRRAEEKNKIKGSPTKEFFISMLIKDITLKDAIGDLIDNSVDGAKRSNNKNDLSGYSINIKANKSKFEIIDNCGGIDIKIAREYAFRFGRPKEYKIEKDSISQFGIGMKRAFFKIGNVINIKSVSSKSRFEMELDVLNWQKNEDDWDFKFTSYDETLKNIPEMRGTTISITDLSEDSENNFGLNNFFKDLIDEIAYEHLYNINKRLKIIINGDEVKPPELTMIYDKDFKPAYWFKKFENGLSVRVLAGISEDIGDEGGWYIFCNDRLVTGPDISADTGWTGRREGADGVAAYHDQFHRFRGYVFFNANNATKLPWNTMKTGLDIDSSKYQSVRKQMITMMKPVMTLMNQLKKEKEKDKPKVKRILNRKVEDARVVSISKVLKERKKLSNTFVYPKIKSIIEQLGMGRISYLRPYSKIEKVKTYFGVTKLGEVGERTFDYVYDHKIGK